MTNLRTLGLLAAVLFTVATAPARAVLISDTVTVNPFTPGGVFYPLDFDLGGPLFNITWVALEMDPCNAFGNESPVNCSNSIGTAEPVTVAIADLSPVFLPVDGTEIDLPLTQVLTLTGALLADLADGLISATAISAGTGPGSGAVFVDFTLFVEADRAPSGVPLPSVLALLLLGLLALAGGRRPRTAALPNR